jgi:molecular chaperone DnaJ
MTAGMDEGILEGFWEDHYAVLGVTRAASAAELRRAFRRLVLRWHPDRAGAGAASVFRQITAAYAVLSDPVSRAAFDRRRGGGRDRSPPAPEPPVSPRRRAPGVMIARLSAPLNALIAGGDARRAEAGMVELLVDDEEAESGGMVTISMRVPVACPGCGGLDPGGCSRCGGSGEGDDLFSAWLAIPPGVADGTILEPSAQLKHGLRPVRFRVRLRRRRSRS